MDNKTTKRFGAFGVMFTGDVKINGPMIDIHDNEHVHLNTEKMGSPVDQKRDSSEKQTSSQQQSCSEEMFKYVHPSLDDEEGWKIHNEVKRLVKRQGIQEICQYLNNLVLEKKIFLPKMPSVAYVELVRMGMPDEEGFTLKTFMKYYRK